MTSGAIHKHKDKKDKKTHEKKQKKKKKPNKSDQGMENDISYAEDSGEGFVDLRTELHPIGYYINDREEMINQMFSIIKADKLRAMLPPILKDSTMDELMSLCLEELLGMSTKRIHSVLEGRELETSSDSDDASSDSNNENVPGTSSTDNKVHWSSDDMKAETQNGDMDDLDEDVLDVERNGFLNGPIPDMDTLEIGITRKEMGELLNYMPSDRRCERKRYSSECEAEPNVPATKRNKNKSSTRRKVKESEKQHRTLKKTNVECDEVGTPSLEGRKPENMNDCENTVKTDESKGKTLLEILELEMRARAIRALLKQQIGTGEGEDTDACMAIECDGESADVSESSPSASLEIKKSLTLNVVKETACYDKFFSIHNQVDSNTSSKSIRQRFRLRRHETMPQNQHDSNTEHANSTVSVIPTLADTDDVSDLTASSNYVELCLPIKIDNTVSTQQSEGTRETDQVTNEDSVQSNLSSNVKVEVIHDGKIEEVESVKSVNILKSNTKEQKSKLDSVQCREIDETMKTVVLLHELDREDGELSSEGECRSSSESVLEVQPDSCSNDVIILDDSDDEVSLTGAQTEVSQKLENLLELDNCSNIKQNNKPISTRISETSKDFNVGPHKSSISVTKNLLQTEHKELLNNLIGSDVNEFKKSGDQNRKGESTDCSWATRWLQSKGVQKVVSTSKMCAKIRKRMKSAQKVMKVTTLANDSNENSKSSVIIVGSVNEYNMLDKPKSDDGETVS